MNLADYQTQSRTTALYPDRDRNLWYPMLGLVGEVAEFLNAAETQKLKEAGDVAWYCAQLCSEAELALETVVKADRPSDPIDLLSQLGILSECIKKLYRDRQGIVQEGDRTILTQCLNPIWHTCIPEADQTQILTQNIEKLLSRQKRGVLGGSGDNR